nr:MAG TPA: hypothetical protein [Crassvirales sp.]
MNNLEIKAPDHKLLKKLEQLMFQLFYYCYYI